MAYNAPTFLKRESVKPFKEQGSAGVAVYGGYIQEREKNPKLNYLQRNTRYEELIANLAVVGAGVRYFTTLATSASWSVVAHEDDKDGKYKDYAEKIIHKLDHSWSSVVAQGLNHRWFGFSVQEWVAKRDEDDGIICFRAIENRPQRSIVNFDPDPNGQIVGFGQTDYSNLANTLYIPRAKTIYLVDDTYTDSPAGLGILRHIYESCERLSNYMDLEKMGFERDLRNIPVGRVPYTELAVAVNNGIITQEQSDAAIAQMEAMVKMARKGNTTGLLLDSKPYVSQTDTALNVSVTPQWDIGLLGGDQNSTNGLPDIAKAIERLQLEISRTIGTEGMLLSGSGSNAMAKEKNGALYLNINSALQTLQFQFNKDLIDVQWKLNGFPNEMKPTFKVSDVNQADAESIAAVLRDVATAGAPLAPDDEVINDLRNLLGVSAVDLEKAMQTMLDQQELEMQSHEANIAVMDAKAKQTTKPAAKK